jgi:hypothetical protein
LPVEEILTRLIGMLDSLYVRRVAIAMIIARTPLIHRPISLFRHIDQISKRRSISLQLHPNLGAFCAAPSEDGAPAFAIAG